MNISKILGRVLEFFNIRITKHHPRESILFAKKYFNGKKIIACEIGVYRGENAKSILKTLDVIKMFLIDPYQTYNNHCKSLNPTVEKEFTNSSGSISKERLAKAFAWARKILRKYPVEWKIGKSEDKIIEIDPCDLIYIDGDHTYEGVKKDLELSWDKLKTKGILIGNDFDIEGINLAVNDFIQKKKLRIYANRTDWWIIKN